jgi:hypothetical protein
MVGIAGCGLARSLVVMPVHLFQRMHTWSTLL